MSIPTANGVSRTLGKAHKRSTATGTRVPGIRLTTAGYVARATPSGDKVTVEHRLSSTRDRRTGGGDLVEAATRRYAETLIEAGYDVEVTYRGVSSLIVVTGRA